MRTPIENLKAIRQLIETYGWVQGTYGSWAQGYCLAGALLRVAPTMFATRDEAMVAALAPLPASLRGLAIWNDQPGRTKEDVLAFCDRAIARLENAA